MNIFSKISCIESLSLKEPIYKQQSMATYLKEEEIKTLLGGLIDKYVEESRMAGKLIPDFVELIKHNFYAKYVHYDPASEMVEIGINESKIRTPGYPDIKVYHYDISESRKWLGKKFQNTNFDLEFYARLIGKDQDADSEIIVIDRENGEK